MKHLRFHPAADAALARLRDTPGLAQLYDNTNDWLDRLEDGETSAEVRRIAYDNGYKAIPVHGSGWDYYIIWREHPEEAETRVIGYIGPELKAPLSPPT